jgi:Protein of unknown function (DUF3300)
MVTLKRRGCSSLLTSCLVAILWTSGHLFSVAWAQGEYPPPPETAAPLAPGAPETPAPLSNDELDELVAPIALYPDALVAQILAGSTYPTEVVEAARWQNANAGLSGDNLAAAVDSSNWDPSIKALTQFPSVLANMSNNLAWTSALGQAYYYQPEDVLNAVQVMRHRALAARTLVNTPQQRYYDQNGMIMIEPVNSNEVYIPDYNPADIYGAPMEVYPGYSTGEMVGAGLLAFGAGIAVGVLASQAWGWHRWNTDWHHHHVTYQNSAYVSNTNNFAPVGSYGRGRGGNFDRQASRTPQGGFNLPQAGGSQRAAAGGYRPNPSANRPPNENRHAHPPIEARPPAGPEGGHRANPPANRQPNENRQPVAPIAAAPPAGARPPYIAKRAPAPPSVRNEPRPQARQANPYRGFAKAPAPGLNKTAFARIAPGGEAVAASVRGRASLRPLPKSAQAAPKTHAAAQPAPHAAGTKHKH